MAWFNSLSHQRHEDEDPVVAARLEVVRGEQLEHEEEEVRRQAANKMSCYLRVVVLQYI